MKMTPNPPKDTGYFWWTNLGEHTPTIVYVQRDFRSNRLYVVNDEYNFEIDPKPIVVTESEDEDDEPVITHDGVAYYHGSQFWAGPIELPELGREFIQPDSF